MLFTNILIALNFLTLNILSYKDVQVQRTFNTIQGSFIKWFMPYSINNNFFTRLITPKTNVCFSLLEIERLIQ